MGFGAWRSGALRNDAAPVGQFASEAEASAHGGLDTVVDSSVKRPQLESELYAYAAAEDNVFYGGVYMDAQGVTHVLLTEDTPENRTAVRSIVPLPDEAVVFDTVTYSRAYLESLQDKVTQGMIDRTLPFVTTSALDDRGNCVRVTVTTDDEAALAQLRACDTLGGALVIEHGAAIAQEDVLINGDAQNLPATGLLNDAEHLPATEGSANDAQSVSP